MSDPSPHKQIKINKIKCLICQDIIESTHCHDYKTCECGRCSVDGGLEYLRRVGHPELFVELSEYE